jgi:hypothetical protein
MPSFARTQDSRICSIVKESLLRDVQRVVPGVGIQRIHERAGQKKVFFLFFCEKISQAQEFELGPVG